MLEYIPREIQTITNLFSPRERFENSRTTPLIEQPRFSALLIAFSTKTELKSNPMTMKPIFANEITSRPPPSPNTSRFPPICGTLLINAFSLVDKQESTNFSSAHDIKFYWSAVSLSAELNHFSRFHDTKR